MTVDERADCAMQEADSARA